MDLQIKKSKDRFHSREYMRWISEQPCTFCGKTPCEGHHLRSRKYADGSDALCIPLTRDCHNKLHAHQISDQQIAEIDVTSLQRKFLREHGIEYSHPLTQEEFESHLREAGMTEPPFTRRANRIADAETERLSNLF
jgi:hypothetical protein